MITITPYLNFEGNCEKAFNHYKKVLGGEIVGTQKYKDMPSEEPLPDSIKEMIMHTTLAVTKDLLIMGSDACEGFGPPLQKGNNYSLTISVDSKSEADRIFNGLSEGGEVIMPMNKTFWGAYFGMFFDKFGIQWMVSFDEEQNK